MSAKGRVEAMGGYLKLTNPTTRSTAARCTAGIKVEKGVYGGALAMACKQPFQWT